MVKLLWKNSPNLDAKTRAAVSPHYDVIRVVNKLAPVSFIVHVIQNNEFDTHGDSCKSVSVKTGKLFFFTLLSDGTSTSCSWW